MVLRHTSVGATIVTVSAVRALAASATNAVIAASAARAVIVATAAVVNALGAATTSGVSTLARSGDLVATNDPNRPWRPVQEPPTPPPPSFGSMLGVLALAVGVGVLGVYMLDGHSHTCEACGNRWRHLGAFNVGDPGAHTCTKCSTVQWWKDGVPHVFRDALRQAPAKTTPTTLASRLQEIREAPRHALATAGWPRGDR